eukprot:TRINITY_DN1323_c0_g1_i1.p1 TRINITY_DN1323_c0_g1~~TRINITY_DN1323_c0_g1_i1.p1  ORF type:complete len:246 (+),score=104.13 TRINITY_DN1323_c0_g1_i1:69-740(+)
MGLGSAYILAYNVAQTVGWGIILYKLIHTYATAQTDDVFETAKSVWGVTSTLVLWFQNAAVLEVVNVMLGLVRAGLVTTFMQVLSRVILVSAVALICPPTQVSWAFSTMIFCWSLTETIRYTYYITETFKITPFALKWLRYSLFIVLYPLGVASEIMCVVVAMPYVAETNIGNFPLPNKWNISFNFYYFLVVWLICYLPGLPKLYTHMLSQRRTHLSSKDKTH